MSRKVDYRKQNLFKPVYLCHWNRKFHTNEIPKGIAGIWQFLPGQGLQEPACYSPALWLEEWSSPSWPWPLPCLDFSMGKGSEDAALPHCDEVPQSSTPEGNSNSMILTQKKVKGTCTNTYGTPLIRHGNISQITWSAFFDACNSASWKTQIMSF